MINYCVAVGYAVVYITPCAMGKFTLLRYLSEF